MPGGHPGWHRVGRFDSGLNGVPKYVRTHGPRGCAARSRRAGAAKAAAPTGLAEPQCPRAVPRANSPEATPTGPGP